MVMSRSTCSCAASVFFPTGMGTYMLKMIVKWKVSSTHDIMAYSSLGTLCMCYNQKQSSSPRVAEKKLPIMAVPYCLMPLMFIAVAVVTTMGLFCSSYREMR